MRIETKNLIIRPFEASDLESVFDYMSDEATTHYLFEGCLSREGVSEFISTPSKSYAIVLSSGELVGHIEFHLWFAERTYEIGWAINPTYQRRGFAYEAASAVISYGFDTLGLHRIIATCQPENHASYRLMEKLGMVREGHFRQCFLRENGVWWDEYFYSMLETDYKALS